MTAWAAGMTVAAQVHALQCKAGLGEGSRHVFIATAMFTQTVN